MKDFLMLLAAEAESYLGKKQFTFEQLPEAIIIITVKFIPSYL